MSIPRNREQRKARRRDPRREVVESCPVPILVAGGAKRQDEDGLQLARDTIAAGAAGVVFGRNVFQAGDPAATFEAFRHIVHRGPRLDRRGSAESVQLSTS